MNDFDQQELSIGDRVAYQSVGANLHLATVIAFTPKRVLIQAQYRKHYVESRKLVKLSPSCVLINRTLNE
jgi:hypothetical protein